MASKSKKPRRIVLLPADSPNRTRTPEQIAAAVAVVRSSRKASEISQVNSHCPAISSRAGLAILALCITGQVNRADDSFVVTGRVLDQQGQPVANVQISTYWNANGVTRDEALKFEEEGGDDTQFSLNEGRMEPWGLQPGKTDIHGNFSVMMGWRNYTLLAIDEEQRRGAIFSLDPRKADSVIELKLVPLVRLKGRLRCAAVDQEFESATVVVRVPQNSTFPLNAERLAKCSSFESRFEFVLPPGDYFLEAFGHVHPGHVLVPNLPVTLPVDQYVVDVGTIVLSPEPPTLQEILKESNSTPRDVDLTKLYGQPPPHWHIVDARGIATDARISDFKGKWVLIYIWGPWCAPCLGKTLPQLMEFYSDHEGDRDRFEIVSICIDHSGDLTSMSDLDRRLEPIVKNVWKGSTLPFPVILDNTLTTNEIFGLDAVGKRLLIDPSGRLAPGDEATLAEKLKAE